MTEPAKKEDDGIVHGGGEVGAFKDFMRTAAREIARGMFKSGAPLTRDVTGPSTAAPVSVTVGSVHASWTTSTPRSRVTSRPRPGSACCGRTLPISGPSSGLPESIRPGMARSRSLWMTGS